MQYIQEYYGSGGYKDYRFTKPIDEVSQRLFPYPLIKRVWGWVDRLKIPRQAVSFCYEMDEGSSISIMSNGGIFKKQHGLVFFNGDEFVSEGSILHELYHVLEGHQLIYSLFDKSNLSEKNGIFQYQRAQELAADLVLLCADSAFYPKKSFVLEKNEIKTYLKELELKRLRSLQRAMIENRIGYSNLDSTYFKDDGYDVGETHPKSGVRLMYIRRAIDILEGKLDY